VGVGTYTHRDDRKEKLEVKETTDIGATAGWTAGNNIAENYWNMKVAKAIPITNSEHKSEYLRFASYRVKLSFQGRTRTYKAMFLFGVGDLPVFAEDQVVNMAALNTFIRASVYPEVLLESSQSQRPAVSSWLRLHQMDSPNCRAGQKEVCCDTKTMACGIAPGDIQKALDNPLSQGVKPPAKQEATNASPRPARIQTVAFRPFTPRVTVLCEDYGFEGAGLVANNIDSTQHTGGGNHSWHDAPTGSCSYTGGPSNTCIASVTATTDAGLSVSDAGSVIPAGNCHKVAKNYQNGSGSGAPATANSNAAAEAVPCSAPCDCTQPIITMSGTNPSFTAGNIWNVQNPYSISCPVRTVTSGSPIIIDTTGRGFHLTSAQNGVEFDLSGRGTRSQMAWTDGMSGNAFLALDRNGNGIIDDGTELFGNYTDQPKSDDPNGFLALAVFDDPKNGGNGDGIIDDKDAIWPKLRLWIDENHDGICQPNELHTLPELGVFSISLKYVHSRHYDQYGNLFRYKGKVNPEGEPRGDNVDRVLYDVYLAFQ